MSISSYTKAKLDALLGGKADLVSGAVPDAQLPARLSDASLEAAYVSSVGTATDPITDAATARPATVGVVYWLCANGVTPTNAADGDLIWNADA